MSRDPLTSIYASRDPLRPLTRAAAQGVLGEKLAVELEAKNKTDDSVEYQVCFFFFFFFFLPFFFLERVPGFFLPASVFNPPSPEQVEAQPSESFLLAGFRSTKVCS